MTKKELQHQAKNYGKPYRPDAQQPIKLFFGPDHYPAPQAVRAMRTRNGWHVGTNTESGEVSPFLAPHNIPGRLFALAGGLAAKCISIAVRTILVNNGTAQVSLWEITNGDGTDTPMVRATALAQSLIDHGVNPYHRGLRVSEPGVWRKAVRLVTTGR